MFIPNTNSFTGSKTVVRHPYRSLLDDKDAYEQIRIIPEHVHRTLFTTPDGTMESLVCNGPASYQTLMNYVFAPYIGVFMDVYLDDIVIYSDSITAHVDHIRLVFEVLRREKPYLGADKMNFFSTTLRILGHVIDEHGIIMDPHKVDKVSNWKQPTNKALLNSFIGAVGYLAGDCKNIRIPMAILNKRAGATKLWRWGSTEQWAFEEIKQIVQDYRNNNLIAIDYSPNAEYINVVTDACCICFGTRETIGVRDEHLITKQF